MTQDKSIPPPKTWQELLSQAFRKTTIKTSESGHASLVNIRQFVYQSLKTSGIENRSPFSLWQLAKIHISAKGNPELIRQQCISTVLSMSKPAFCLLSNNSIVLIMFILSLVTLLTPITANTFKTHNTSSSILKIITLPWQDIENEVTTLPLTTDYSQAAFNISYSKEQKQLEKLNAKSWILDQKSTSYSLQLLSVSRKENLVKFCKKHNICDHSAFYTTQVKGKKLVRLIYGSYPSHKAAKLAKTDLTSRLKGISPWARSFKQIKNEL